MIFVTRMFTKPFKVKAEVTPINVDLQLLDMQGFPAMEMAQSLTSDEWEELAREARILQDAEYYFA